MQRGRLDMPPTGSTGRCSRSREKSGRVHPRRWSVHRSTTAGVARRRCRGGRCAPLLPPAGWPAAASPVAGAGTAEAARPQHAVAQLQSATCPSGVALHFQRAVKRDSWQVWQGLHRASSGGSGWQRQARIGPSPVACMPRELQRAGPAKSAGKACAADMLLAAPNCDPAD